MTPLSVAAFAESDLPMRVDVVDWHAISDEFGARIASDCVVLVGPCDRRGG